MTNGPIAELEARPYGPDSSPEEIAAMRACVYPHALGIIMYQEPPVGSMFQTEVYMTRLRELLDELGRSSVIVDLRQVDMGSRPDAAHRAHITDSLAAMGDRVERIAVVTDKLLFKVGTRFIAAPLPFEVKVYASIPAAEEGLRGHGR